MLCPLYFNMTGGLGDRMTTHIIHEEILYIYTYYIYIDFFFMHHSKKFREYTSCARPQIGQKQIVIKITKCLFARIFSRFLSFNLQELYP